MLKKFLTIFLCMVIVAGSLLFGYSTVFAEYSGQCGDNLTWNYNEDECELTISGTGAMYSYSNSIVPPWAPHSLYIEKIIIENGVTTIGEYAFWRCVALLDVEIGDDVDSIAENAFYYCKKLASITISKAVTKIDYTVFYGCESLEAINVSGDNMSFSSEDGVLLNKNKTALVLYAPGKKDVTYSIPSSVDTIGYGAFYGNYFLEIMTIPDTVTQLGINAFSDSKSLHEFTFPNAITAIPSLVLSHCEKLETVNIPNGITSIGNYAFLACTSLENIKLPYSLKSIGNYAFDSCTALKQIVLPNMTERLDYNAFSNCPSLTGVTIPRSVTTIHIWTFLNSNNILINTYSNSYAHKFALDNAIPFSLIDVEPTTTVPPTTSTEPSTTEPSSTEPSSTEPSTTEPSTTEPSSTEPSTTEPSSTEPSSTEPSSTEPSTTEPAKPTTTVPIVTEYIPNYTPTPFGGVKMDNDKMHITGVKPKTTIQEFYSFFVNSNFKVWDFNDDEVRVGSYVASGYRVFLVNSKGARADLDYNIVVKGDVLGTGEITTAGARKVLRYAVKIEMPDSTWREAAADVNNDGYIKTNDARLVLRVAVKIDSKFPD